MTNSTADFLRTATASASFLRLPAESQAMIQAHAARFGTPTMKISMKEIKARLEKRRAEYQASGQPAVSNTGAPGTITREAFNKLSHAERNQFFRNGGKIAAPEHHLSAWQSVNDRINPPKKQL